jgi:hypothetical protein
LVGFTGPDGTTTPGALGFVLAIIPYHLFMFVANKSLFGGIISKILLREDDIATTGGTAIGSGVGALGNGNDGGIDGEGGGGAIITGLGAIITGL